MAHRVQQFQLLFSLNTRFRSSFLTVLVMSLYEYTHLFISATMPSQQDRSRLPHPTVKLRPGKGGKAGLSGRRLHSLRFQPSHYLHCRGFTFRFFLTLSSKEKQHFLNKILSLSMDVDANVVLFCVAFFLIKKFPA